MVNETSYVLFFPLVSPASPSFLLPAFLLPLSSFTCFFSSLLFIVFPFLHYPQTLPTYPPFPSFATPLLFSLTFLLACLPPLPNTCSQSKEHTTHQVLAHRLQKPHLDIAQNSTCFLDLPITVFPPTSVPHSLFLRGHFSRIQIHETSTTLILFPYPSSWNFLYFLSSILHLFSKEHLY